MPGTSEKFEARGLDSLPIKLWDPARDILNSADLPTILSFNRVGISQDYKNRYPALNEYEWDSVIRKTVFSKITSLEINIYFSAEEIEYLLETLADAYGFHELRLMTVNDVPADFFIARDWLLKAHAVLRYVAR